MRRQHVAIVMVVIVSLFAAGCGLAENDLTTPQGTVREQLPENSRGERILGVTHAPSGRAAVIYLYWTPDRVDTVDLASRTVCYAELSQLPDKTWDTYLHSCRDAPTPQKIEVYPAYGWTELADQSYQVIFGPVLDSQVATVELTSQEGEPIQVQVSEPYFVFYLESLNVGCTLRYLDAQGAEIKNTVITEALSCP
jgi:hypothetical protein